MLHGHVENGDLLTRGDEIDCAIEELGGDEGLIRTLLESAQIHRTGHDDGAGVDRGDLGHRHEDAPTWLHLDDEPGQARGVEAGAQHHDAIADLADLVSVGIEDTNPREAGEEDPRCGTGRHGGRLPSLEPHPSLAFLGRGTPGHHRPPG